MYKEQLHLEAIYAFHVKITLLSPRTWGFDPSRIKVSTRRSDNDIMRCFLNICSKHSLLHRYAFIEEGHSVTLRVSVSRETNRCNPTLQTPRRWLTSETIFPKSLYASQWCLREACGAARFTWNVRNLQWAFSRLLISLVFYKWTAQH